MQSVTNNLQQLNVIKAQITITMIFFIAKKI